MLVGEVNTVTGSYGPVDEGDLPGPIFNTAGVTGTTPINTPVGPVTDTHSVPVTIDPSLDINKTGTAGPVTIGDTVYYTITVENTGNVTLTNVTVRDAKLGLVQNVGTLVVGEVATVTGSYGPVDEGDLPGPIFNTAGVTATTPFGPPPSPVTDTHTVNITPPAQFVEGVVYYDVDGDGVCDAEELACFEFVIESGNFPTLEAAFLAKYEDYKGKASTHGRWRSASRKPLLPSICVDAACSGAPLGVSGVRGRVVPWMPADSGVAELRGELGITREVA